MHLLLRKDAVVVKISSWFHLTDQSEVPTLIQAMGRTKLRKMTHILNQGKYKICMFSFGPEHRSLDWHCFIWLAAESCALGHNLGRKHDPRNSREAGRVSKWTCPASPRGPKVTTTKISSSAGAVTCSNLCLALEGTILTVGKKSWKMCQAHNWHSWHWTAAGLALEKFTESLSGLGWKAPQKSIYSHTSH